MSADAKRVPVTTLTIESNDIDWSIFKEKFQLYAYRVRPKYGDEKYYYAKIHNWYKTVCDDPCYFNTNDRRVYVLYSSSKEVGSLRYEKDEIKPQRIDISDPKMFHALVKTLVSNYFHLYERFVSNADFFLPVANLDSDFITMLKIRVNQNWKNSNEFFFKDEAKLLRKLENPQPNDFWIGTNYYGISYDQDGNPIFKQLKYNSIRLSQRNRGVYIPYSSRKNRPQVAYHSVNSLKDLQKSRSYVLNKFFRGLLNYFSQLGLPFKYKELDMQKIESPKKEEMKKPQISIGDQPIYIVDDRMRPTVKPDLEPENFAREFCASITKLLVDIQDKSKGELFNGNVPNIILGDAPKLPDGSYVLRIQDNEKSDFVPTKKIDPSTKEEIIDKVALFNGFDDPLHKFYEAYPNLVIQTMNINDNTKIRHEEKRRKRKSSQTEWDLDNYLDYGQPDIDQNSLEVSLNQLILKDIVMHPQKAAALLPQEQLDIITNKVFIYGESLLYFDSTNLIFMPVSGNSEQALKFIKDVTGKDLISDVLKPAMEYKKYQFSEEDLENNDELTQILKQGRFIITKDYVWQIVDNSERMLYPDAEIETRLENLAEKRPIRDFYPKFPLTGDEPFNEQQLQDYDKFLKERVDERYISYDKLKEKYANIKAKNEKGRMVKTGEGIYPVLGISNDTKFKAYLRDCLGLPFESVRSNDVITVYQGIWYEPNTRQYLVGDKGSRNVDQEKGFVLREILVHHGNTDENELFKTLNTDFFPMLQANFIRHKQYTVYPFPFNLIQIWQKIRGSN